MAYQNFFARVDKPGRVTPAQASGKTLDSEFRTRNNSEDKRGNYDLSTGERAPEAFDDLKAARAALDAVEIVAEADRFGGFSAIYAEVEEADSEDLESVKFNDPIYEKNFREYPEFLELYKKTFGREF